MKPGTTIASGVGSYPELHKEPVKWIAVRGDIHDWALYYHEAEMPLSYVRDHGDKSFTESVIRKLVPCDDEAFAMYRH